MLTSTIVVASHFWWSMTTQLVDVACSLRTTLGPWSVQQRTMYSVLPDNDQAHAPSRHCLTRLDCTCLTDHGRAFTRLKSSVLSRVLE